MRYRGFVTLFLALTACQATYMGDETSPFYLPPVGSRLVLKQELTIPDGHAGVRLQGGRVVRDKDVNQYRPSCRLEVNEVRDTAQTVSSDEFLVRRVRAETSIATREGFMHARLIAQQDGGVTFFVYRTRLDLESAHQPQVRELVCEQWDEPAKGRHVTIREIRVALGDVFLLILPADTTHGTQ